MWAQDRQLKSVAAQLSVEAKEVLQLSSFYRAIYLARFIGGCEDTSPPGIIGLVVQRLAHWTLNPAIAAQIRAGPPLLLFPSLYCAIFRRNRK